MTDSFVERSYERGQALLARRTDASRKQHGQFLTPPAIARFMARQLAPVQSGHRILDPACGSGVLACAMIERAILDEQPIELWLDCYEIDSELCEATREALSEAAGEAKAHGVVIHSVVHECDFVLGEQPLQQPLFSTLRESGGHTYSQVIANPPYFKLSQGDPRARYALANKLSHTNIYALFMSLAVRQLADNGCASFIVPRSFCSGDYFSSFRRQFVHQAIPLAIHLFDSRQEAFQKDDVLQENIILLFRRRPPTRLQGIDPQIIEGERVTVSASSRAGDTVAPQVSHTISVDRYWRQHNGHLFFKLPLSEYDERVVETVEAWTGSLGKFGLDVSTGPVVAFRAAAWLMDGSAHPGQSVPLLWMQNVSRHQVKWPLQNTGKPQSILATAPSGLLVPGRNSVLVRRFSAKEEPHRVVAAPLLVGRLGSDRVGLENHLNYIHPCKGDLSVEQTLGLSAVLNSNLVDRYIRIANGNTQVNAAELRALSLPGWEAIEQIGKRLLAVHANSPSDIDELSEGIVFATLLESRHWPEDLPNLRESRITMNKMQKIQQAQHILQALGLPAAQQNEQSALTLLVLGQLSENTAWKKASPKALRIHDILAEIKERYDREYAENTRETIRRQVIHQFEQAGLVARNPDLPDLPTNSPRTSYVLTDIAVRVLRAYGTKGWRDELAEFNKSQGSLLDLYARSREQVKVPLQLASGESYSLSAGKHNELQAAIVQEFGPRFAPGSKILYLMDC